MRRFLLGCTAGAALLGASAAWAGGTVEPTPEPEVIPAAGSSSSSGVLVPILLLLVLAAAASSSGGGSGAQASDRRLKTDIAWIGMARNGLPLYRYRYLGHPQVFEGVMAQDVANLYPEAVRHSAAGWMGVDYDRLGLQMRRVA